MVNLSAILDTISKVVKAAVDLGPGIIKLEEDARPFAEAIWNTLKGTTITQTQLDALEAKITELSNQLQEPLPPDDA